MSLSAPALAFQGDRDRLAQMPRHRISVASALFLAQRCCCFHCAGHMPAIHTGKAYSRPVRDYALPEIARPKGAAFVANVLAHRLCTWARGERALTPAEWRRCADIWLRADRHWIEAGSSASPFPAWVELAHQQERSTP